MADWKKDEVNYRLAKMVLQTLMHEGLLDESEAEQVLHLYCMNMPRLKGTDGWHISMAGTAEYTRSLAVLSAKTCGAAYRYFLAQHYL